MAPPARGRNTGVRGRAPLWHARCAERGGRPASRGGHVRRRHRRRSAGWMLPLCAVFAACGLPRDPEGTLERARGGVLRVGGVDAPPHLVREGAAASGPEAELVYAFARSLGAEVEWH